MGLHSMLIWDGKLNYWCLDVGIVSKAFLCSRIVEAMHSVNAVVFKAGGLEQPGLESNAKLIYLVHMPLFHVLECHTIVVLAYFETM